MKTLVLPYPPSANRYWRSDRGGRPHLSDEARAFRGAVQMRLLTQRMPLLEGEVAVTIAVYRPAKRGDLDNTIKVLLDALKGFAYLDDSQVTLLSAERFDDKANPRAEVVVTAREAA